MISDQKDRRVPHTRRSSQLSARGGLSGRHTRLYCEGKRSRDLGLTNHGSRFVVITVGTSELFVMISFIVTVPT